MSQPTPGRTGYTSDRRFPRHAVVVVSPAPVQDFTHIRVAEKPDQPAPSQYDTRRPVVLVATSSLSLI